MLLLSKLKILLSARLWAIVGSALALLFFNQWQSTQRELNLAREMVREAGRIVNQAREGERRALERLRQDERDLTKFLTEDSTDEEWSDTPIPSGELDRMRSFYNN